MTGRSLVVIPTYNELANVRELVPAILARYPGLDVLVVDDASPDGTGEYLRSLAETEGRVSLIARKCSRSRDGLRGRLRALPSRGVRDGDPDGRRPFPRSLFDRLPPRRRRRA